MPESESREGEQEVRSPVRAREPGLVERCLYRKLTYFCAIFLIAQYLLACHRLIEDGGSIYGVLPATLMLFAPAIYIILSETREKGGGQLLAGLFFGFCAFGSFIMAVSDGVEGPIKYSDFQVYWMKVLAALMMLAMFLCLSLYLGDRKPLCGGANTEN